MLASLDLQAYLWIPPPKRKDIGTLPVLTKLTLSLWDTLIESLHISAYIGPLTLLFDNTSFPIGAHGHILGSWTKLIHYRFWTKLINHCLLLVDSSLPNPTVYISDEYRMENSFLQQEMNTFLVSVADKQKRISNPTLFEDLLLSDSPPKQTISKIYSILSLLSQPNPPAYTVKW